MSLPTEPVVVRQVGGTLWLTLNRIEALNALNNAMLDTLLDRLREAAARVDVRCVVLAGAGDKAFCAGIDLAERQSLDAEGKGEQSRRVLALVQALHLSPKPVVAAIGGWCLGAGLELALACDVRIAAAEARFAFPEMTLGAYPGGGGLVLLARLIGRARAMEWLLSNKRLSADEAQSLGLVSRCVPRKELEAAVEQTGACVASLAPLAVAALKASIDQGLDLPLDQAFAIDQKFRRPLDATNDYQEGLRAHKEKRSPVFTGS